MTLNVGIKVRRSSIKQTQSNFTPEKFKDEERRRAELV